MSRTYRRKSGSKWWREKDFTYIRDRNGKWIHNPTEEEIEWYKKYMISVYEGRDYYSHPGITKDLLKWHGNLLRRTCKKEQIYKVLMTDDYNEVDYDNTKELLVKGLRWMYD